MIFRHPVGESVTVYGPIPEAAPPGQDGLEYNLTPIVPSPYTCVIIVDVFKLL